MESLIYTVLGVILGWIPQAYVWVRDRFTSTKAPEITLEVPRPYDRAGARYKCKIHVKITNQSSGQTVRIGAPYFVFDERALLNPDPNWTPEHGTGRFRVRFLSPSRTTHDWRDVYLRPGDKTDTWIAVDPRYLDHEIDQAIGAQRIGELNFQITRWTDSGSPKTNAVNFSSARTTKRFPSPRCASAIQIVRPLQSKRRHPPNSNRLC
jgi:hypothetical protein